MTDTPVFFIRDPAKFPHFIHVCAWSRFVPLLLTACHFVDSEAEPSDASEGS